MSDPMQNIPVLVRAVGIWEDRERRSFRAWIRISPSGHVWNLGPFGYADSRVDGDELDDQWPMRDELWASVYRAVTTILRGLGETEIVVPETPTDWRARSPRLKFKYVDDIETGTE